MNKKLIILALMIFAFGWLANSIIGAIAVDQRPMPTVFLDNVTEKPSPSDWVDEKNILVMDDKVVINVSNAQWASFTDTNSMDPLFDSTANAIEIIPSSPEQINVGDIISYTSSSFNGVVIHRVIEKGSDENGVYFILKGDNNNSADPDKVRFNQIQRVLVAIIY